MRAAVTYVGNILVTHRPALSCRQDYSVSSLVLMFFTFSGIGWLWEVGLHLVVDGMFFNRGFMAGPWLPIYGTGVVLILVLLKKWRSRPLLSFGLIVLLCGTVEYFAGLFLETMFGVRWWNYSDMLFQIQGRVCLEGLLLFGTGGLFIIYIAAPALDGQFSRLSGSRKRLLCVILCLLFAADLVRSFLSPNMGPGITSL